MIYLNARLLQSVNLAIKFIWVINRGRGTEGEFFSSVFLFWEDGVVRKD